MRELGELIGEHIPYVQDYLAEAPRTLVHGDFRLGNMFFTRIGEEPAMAVLDWQAYRCGKGAYDAAFFIAMVVDPGHHSSDGIQLLRNYHSSLGDNGVLDYSFEQCLIDYRMTLLERTTFAVRALALLDFSSEGGQQIAERLVPRMAAPLLELDAVSLLPG